jgi:hypothetical protein
MAYLPAQEVRHKLRHIYRGKADSELGEPSTSFTKGTNDVGTVAFSHCREKSASPCFGGKFWGEGQLCGEADWPGA